MSLGKTRALLYVPVIHTSADLGTLSEKINKKGVADLGEEMWNKHKQNVDRFWSVIAEYFERVDAEGLKIYQDGMVADGEIGAMIVEAGVKSGSKNYEIVQSLMRRQGILVRTEKLELAMEEKNRLLALTQQDSPVKKLLAILKYKFTQNKMLKRRDGFIAQRISETLSPGERGVIFIGAFHHIRNKLPADIEIIEVKPIKQVRAYQRMLPYIRSCNRKYERLNRRLTASLVIKSEDNSEKNRH